MIDDLAVAHLLADAVDAVTEAAFRDASRLKHDDKADGTAVSHVDVAVEQTLLHLVKRHRPHDAFLGEEVGAHGAGTRRWVVDGIDGTRNLIRGDPL